MRCFYTIHYILLRLAVFGIEISDKIQDAYTFHDTPKISQQKLETEL